MAHRLSYAHSTPCNFKHSTYHSNSDTPALPIKLPTRTTDRPAVGLLRACQVERVCAVDYTAADSGAPLTAVRTSEGARGGGEGGGLGSKNTNILLTQ